MAEWSSPHAELYVTPSRGRRFETGVMGVSQITDVAQVMVWRRGGLGRGGGRGGLYSQKSRGIRSGGLYS